MGGNIFNFCLCRHDRDQFVKVGQQKTVKYVEFLLLVHVGTVPIPPLILSFEGKVKMSRDGKEKGLYMLSNCQDSPPGMQHF